MGILTVLHYPTKAFFSAADHSYVQCGSGGLGWKCWGYKKGGKPLRQGHGSTVRADAIAQADERAGITWYLVNGVCHQASNRILIPASSTADGVRGYTLSVALFGPYGRQSGVLGFAQAPLLLHTGITGDLSPCMAQTGPDITPNPGQGFYDFQDQRYLEAVGELYSAALGIELSVPAGFEMQMGLFKALVAHRMRRLGRRIDRQKYERVMVAREDFERGRVDAERSLFAEGDRLGFCQEFDTLTIQFQEDLAAALDPEEYVGLLGLSPDERIVVADPITVQETYGSQERPGGEAS